MKKFFQIIGLCSILVFSFYYTDKIAVIVEQKNPVLKEIKSKEDDLYVSAVDATITEEYIIPGIYGSKVNVEKSFYNMKALNTFNEYYIIYDDVKPTISIEDNKDKIIIGGNNSKRQVSIILEYNDELINLFQKYNVNLLINKDNYSVSSGFELINNESELKLFNQVNTLLNNDNINKHLCIVNDNNKEICKKNNNYLVQSTLKLSTNNLSEIKGLIENGSIITVSQNAKIEDVKLLLNYIRFRDLEIVYLSDLISEKN